ncbi:DUF4295 family protein [Blattabacterium cuenoti]|uniref:DUF4295 family protein n=1 Tax=Blattabacterium cuenoti TaxID=1653831 RepID=UPI00163C1BF9|nr:DUF4295 family protein [Blattabacterium cuenoti]
MSKKVIENKTKKNSQKKILAIRIIKSDKSDSYSFEKKILSEKEIKDYFNN